MHEAEETEMKTRLAVFRTFALTCLVLALFASQGCTYLQHRGEDFLEIVDLGVTFSKKPGFAIYGDGVSVLTGGYGYVDGWFAGWGGGQLGVTRHFENCWGVIVFGHEKHGWGKNVNPRNPKTYSEQYVGVAGVPVSFVTGCKPDYMPSCIHYLHLGWVGLVANARYMEMIDFIVGWTTFDIGGDDGKPAGGVGHWPWLRAEVEHPLATKVVQR